MANKWLRNKLAWYDYLFGSCFGINISKYMVNISYGLSPFHRIGSQFAFFSNVLYGHFRPLFI